MHKCVMHFVGLTNNRMNNLMYYLPPSFLSVNKMHVLKSRDENSVGPDKLGSGLIWICNVLKKKKIKQSRLSVKEVNIRQLLCKYSHANANPWHFQWPKCP